MDSTTVQKQILGDDLHSDLQPKVELPSEPSTPPSKPQATTPISNRTPITFKVSGTRPHESRSVRASEMRARLEQETRGHWVGPMDPAEFLKRYLPPVTGNTRGARPSFTKKTFVKVPRTTKELTMYQPFIDAMSPFCPELKLVDTHSNWDSTRDSIAVDISAYQVNANGQCGITKCDFAQMEIPVEVKPKDSLDPFADFDDIPASSDDKPYPFERHDDSALAIDARGQVASYSSALLNAQFRVHAFSVLVIGNSARLLRWDRNGAIVTRKFAYHEVDHLVEFFWRYSDAPRDIRGHDPTVWTLLSSHRPTTKEILAREQLQDANKIHHIGFRTMLIPDRDTGVESLFLISYPPRYVTRSPFGRSTRSMLAFDISQDKMVFVKDYWRSVGDNLEKEGEIYRSLGDAHVPYIAPFGKGNDIRDHETFVDVVKREGWAYPTGEMVSLHHYRISLDEIGRPLTEFRSSHEALTAIADAMEAHGVAFTTAKILHRDISVSNILITERGRGMLIDWDLCLNLNNQSANPRRPKRTGSWQFLSVLTLTVLNHNQNVTDDMESVLYVILWIMLRYTRHNKLERLFEELALFDEVSFDFLSGGSRKHSFLAWKHTLFRFQDRPHLDSLIQDLCLTFLARYEAWRTVTASDLAYSSQSAQDMTHNYEHQERLQHLEDSKWLVGTIRSYLAKEGWPTDDRASLNEIGGPGTTAQREKRQKEIAENAIGGSSFRSLKRSHPDD